MFYRLKIASGISFSRHQHDTFFLLVSVISVFFGYGKQTVESGFQLGGNAQ